MRVIEYINDNDSFETTLIYFDYYLMGTYRNARVSVSEGV